MAERDEAGSMSLEFVILAPVLIALLLLLAIGGRLSETRIAVQGAARSAARAASLEREAGDATEASKKSAESWLKERELTCSPMSIATNTERFKPSTGVGFVTVAVECTVSLVGFELLAAPTSTVVRGSFTEPIDRFREASP